MRSGRENERPNLFASPGGKALRPSCDDEGEAGKGDADVHDASLACGVLRRVDVELSLDVLLKALRTPALLEKSSQFDEWSSPVCHEMKVLRGIVAVASLASKPHPDASLRWRPAV